MAIFSSLWGASLRQVLVLECVTREIQGLPSQKDNKPLKHLYNIVAVIYDSVPKAFLLAIDISDYFEEAEMLVRLILFALD